MPWLKRNWRNFLDGQRRQKKLREITKHANQFAYSEAGQKEKYIEARMQGKAHTEAMKEAMGMYKDKKEYYKSSEKLREMSQDFQKIEIKKIKKTKKDIIDVANQFHFNTEEQKNKYIKERMDGGAHKEAMRIAMTEAEKIKVPNEWESMKQAAERFGVRRETINEIIESSRGYDREVRGRKKVSVLGRIGIGKVFGGNTYVRGATLFKPEEITEVIRVAHAIGKLENIALEETVRNYIAERRNGTSHKDLIDAIKITQINKEAFKAR